MLPDNSSQWPPAGPPQGTRRGGLATLIVGVAVLGALVGFAADRWALTNVTSLPVAASAPAVGTGPRVGPLAAPDGGQVAQTTPDQPTAAPTATTTDPTQLAIQQIIQQGDNEQAQAFENNDPTVMQDTTTSDFYQSQVSTNQDLRSNGVTDIKLVGIDWGAITVDGTSATATAFETWTTTYSDGTTDQTRDRNVYTLVQTNGAWVVSADAHPDDAVAGGAPGATTPGATTPGGQGAPGGRTGRGTGGTGPGTAPGAGGGTGPGAGAGTGSGTGVPGTTGRVPRNPNTSQNWAGYSASGGTYTAVSGTWTVPQFTPDSPAGADATWVGIGGVDTRDLIQAGTQQTVSGSGSTEYQAWVETLPQASHPVPLTINPGDSVSLAITQVPQTQDQWQVSFTNNTTGKTYQVTENYTSSMSSAEWIEEAPSANRGRQLPLDNFGSIDFSQASAVKDGQTVTVAAAGGSPITMSARGGTQLATPSPLTADGAGFTVTHG